ncbi:bifunctional riboflavin kinase/FAD synthetase [Microvirga sp. 2MCAF38]|uniref:bifunctional riboflavin kinase/FAD synthetase n=1 Tax=Microvirga sp. 2MCAF38 TaxID=3232989 RepID=UPI003F95281C
MSLSAPEKTAFIVCRDGDAVPPALTGALAAIGNFDGVHRGHRSLIERAMQAGRPSAVVTFEPHPRLFFQPDKPHFCLTPEPVKLAILQRIGLTGVFIRRFDQALASLSAAAFVDLLASELKLSGVVVGHNFHFGRGREGTPAVMAELCRAKGLDCIVMPAIGEEGEPVSSSAIRSALEQGDIAKANKLLGYRWVVRSDVRHGDKRGRVLGYPTANMSLSADCRLRHGIYAVRAATAVGVFNGVASFGRRPTFDNGAPLLETFLFDFTGDLYDQMLSVEFVGFIRGEEKFESIEELIAQMDRDSVDAKRILRVDKTLSMID